MNQKTVGQEMVDRLTVQQKTKAKVAERMRRATKRLVVRG